MTWLMHLMHSICILFSLLPYKKQNSLFKNTKIKKRFIKVELNAISDKNEIKKKKLHTQKHIIFT